MARAYRDSRTAGAKKLLGIYMGRMNGLSQRKRAQVKRVRAEKGTAQAIAFMKTLT